MASPSPQASTPANSKRKASAMPFNTPPRRPKPAWDTKMDALGHCYEGEVAEDQRKALCKGALESFHTREQAEVKNDKRISEVKGNVGGSRDAVLANLRLLSEAHQRLTARSSDASARYGKEKLSMKDVQPVFGELSKLWQAGAKNTIDSHNGQRDEMLKEREILIEKVKVARQERDIYLEKGKFVEQERDALLHEKGLHLEERKPVEQERDALLHERDHSRQESETLKQELGQLRREKELADQRWLEEKSASESCRIGMVPQAALDEVTKEKDEFFHHMNRYRQERNEAQHRVEDAHKQKHQYQTQLEQMDGYLKEVKWLLNSSDDSKKALETHFRALNRQRDIDTQEHAKTRTELDETQKKLALLDINMRIDHDLGLRRQKEELEGTCAAKLQDLRKELTDNQRTIVRDMTRKWEQEKAQLQEKCDTKLQDLRKVLTDDHELTVCNMTRTRKQEKAQLQGAYNVKLQELKRVLTDKHESIVGDLTQNWEQEKARLVAAATADRDALQDRVAAAEKKKATDSEALKVNLHKLKMLKGTAVASQETMRDLVVAIALLMSSSSDMRGAIAAGGRIIKDDAVRFHVLRNQLTALQEEISKSRLDSTRLQVRLHDQTEELDKLYSTNRANVIGLEEIRTIHAACQQGRRLQLGSIDRHSFFQDFSASISKGLPADSMIFKGQENGWDVDVCFCILLQSDEALCLIQRPNGAFTVWLSGKEDCSILWFSWDRFLCLGGENQGKAIYLKVTGLADWEWLRRTLATRTASGEDMDSVKGTEQS